MHPLASVTFPPNVYVILAPGFTVIGVPDTYPTTAPRPVIVKLYGEVPPLMVTIKFVDCPAQITALPVRIAEVGLGAIVIGRSTGRPAHPFVSITLTFPGPAAPQSTVMLLVLVPLA